MTSKISVCVVTVTYGKRLEYVKRVVCAALNEDNVSNVVVVDNGSSRQPIFEEDSVFVVGLNKNFGSAFGYKEGIKKALSLTHITHVWLLDDDNVPRKGSLNKLLCHLNTFSDSSNKLVQSYRPYFLTHKKIFSSGGNLDHQKIDNCFLDFTLSKIRKIFFNRREMSERNIDVVTTKYTQYGGLLLSREAISQVGLPRDDYFLYADDSEYTYRLTRSGYSIDIIKSSVVEDIDLSWNYVESPRLKKLRSFAYLAMGSDFRVYYSVRNSRRFEIDYFETNRFLSSVNKYVYLTLMFLVAVYTNRLSRFKLIIKAITDAESGKLGEREFVER